MAESGQRRRVDRILKPAFVKGLGGLSIDEVRARRDECLAEREYLSLIRRQVQGRAEILKAEVERRHAGGDQQPLIERLSEVLAPDGERGPSRGEAMRIGLPEEEMMHARRRVERLVGDTGISDPSSMDDERLAEAVELLLTEEREVSQVRAKVLAVHDAFQDELKRRYKDDITKVLGS